MRKIPYYRCIDAKTRNVQFFIKRVGRFSLKLASEKPSFYLFALKVYSSLMFSRISCFTQDGAVVLNNATHTGDLQYCRTAKYFKSKVRPFLYNFCEIRLYNLIFGRIPQDCRGMIGRGQGAVFPVCPGAMLPGNFKIRRNQTLGGNTAKADDDSGLQKKSFIFQIGKASFLFLRLGIPVAGRMAF